jgi:hypothetical protein
MIYTLILQVFTTLIMTLITPVLVIISCYHDIINRCPTYYILFFCCHKIPNNDILYSFHDSNNVFLCNYLLCNIFDKSYILPLSLSNFATFIFFQPSGTFTSQQSIFSNFINFINVLYIFFSSLSRTFMSLSPDEVPEAISYTQF